VSFFCPNGDILCRVGDMSPTCFSHVADTRKCCVCWLECLNDTTFDDMSGNSRHVGNFLIVVWVQTQKLYGRVANSYVWTDLYLSAVIEENWVCRGLFRVNDTQCRPRFGDIWRCGRHVADMSPTCGAKSFFMIGSIYQSCAVKKWTTTIDFRTSILILNVINTLWRGIISFDLVKIRREVE